jgi:hypothetical protein
MVLVIIVGVAWIIILVPSVMKRRSRAVGEIGSISHFHQQLRVLEHSAPQAIVAPAYRLRAVDGSGDPTGVSHGSTEAPVLTVVGADQLPRPALAFLGDDPPSADGGAASGGATMPAAMEVVVVDGSTAVTRSDPQLIPARTGDSLQRQLVRRRRRDTLGVLFGLFIVTALIGFVPGASITWVVTALSGLALVVYVGFLVHLRRMAEEREQKLHYLNPGGVVRAPVAASGRYAHPSNQAVAAR